MRAAQHEEEEEEEGKKGVEEEEEERKRRRMEGDTRRTLVSAADVTLQHSPSALFESLKKAPASCRRHATTALVLYNTGFLF